MISGDEFVELYSTVRMGVASGIIGGIGLEELGGLFIDAQPATMMHNAAKELKPSERDVKRAELVRKVMEI